MTSLNDIASALVKILQSIVETHPTLEELNLWSDSCVKQNKNSIMSFALQDFMQKYPSIKSVVQKFSEKGHSYTKEVESVHSVIDWNYKKVDVYSPLSLVKLLTKIKKNKIAVIQTRPSDFKDFHGSLNYKQVLFQEISMMLNQMPTLPQM